ncbi:MAG: hypothetical protein A2042_07425 [Candidatus Schekmanbacteria bacterium GWA2_38_11]|uniref:Methyltransferase type 11 domain-containing protein n=1 Tax=Candidatus Schekmanbacteria bacterium GWA2_38_11 TaxID=1817876 RepID=A0A1F7RPK8_9BACT|nr:MAG: hypothetical protein A2042_07425 [Candidatus Schekmanbacteria bacterium GWA2_38_11]
MKNDLKEIEQRESHFYDSIYNTYDPSSQIVNINQINWPPFNFVLDYLGDLRGKRVLDCGCGIGWCSVVFALKGAEVFAFDLSEKGIEGTKRLAEKNGMSRKIKAEVMSVYELEYPDNFFDIVFGNAFLHHIDVQKGGKEISRVLKKNGIALFIENSANNKLLMWTRRNLLGKFGSKRFGTEDEMPLSEKEIKTFGSFFKKTDPHYPNFVFFQLLSHHWILKGEILEKTLKGFDNLIVKIIPNLSKYSFEQVAVFLK